VDLLRKIIATIRPKAPLRVSQAVHACSREPTIAIALVRVEGAIPRRGSAYDHGRDTTVQATREDAMIFDLRALELERTSGGCSMFLTGVWAGTNHARCHFVLNEQWLDELRRGPERNRRVYHDVDSAIAAAEADELRRRANREKHAALDLTRIILCGGLGPIRFGMTHEQVRALMGEPDSEDDGGLYWAYEDIDLDLEFKPIRNRGICLVQLTTRNPRVRLLNIPLVGPGFAQKRFLFERAGVKHTSMFVDKGIDWQHFERGFTLYTYGDAVDRIRWTIETDNLVDEEIDWFGAEQIG
jgi:hypothetical protein